MISRNEKEEGDIAGTKPEDGNPSDTTAGPKTSEPERKASDTDGADEKERGPDSDEGKDVKLYKSPRFTGYLTMFLSSIINYHGIIVSRNTNDVHVIASSGGQRRYGYIAASLSCLTSGLCVVCHLDGFSCLANTWKNKLFAPKSKFETILDFSLFFWWFLAVVIQTRSDGIAGDGKGQYNIYFSAWFCLFCAMSVVESKMMEFEWPSIMKFIKSWPHRSPGWIVILISDFFTLWWYVDIYITYDTSAAKQEVLNPMLVSYYGSISSTQYEILILVAAGTLLPAIGFVFMEIFRDSSQDKKGPVETYIEAFCLFALACAWIPGVCVATTPGGFATQIGNSWFFTWATCFLVMETLLWFVSDSRGGIRQTLIEKEQEYQRHQLHVLAAAHDVKELSTPDQQHFDIEQKRDEDLGEIRKSSAETSVAFEMEDGSVNKESLDDSIQQEIHLKETDRNAYFDNLNDILE